MRRISILMVAALGLACGLPEAPEGRITPLDVKINNKYAESIFTVAVTPDNDGLERVVIDGERVDGFKTRTFSDAIDVPGAKNVDIRVNTISVGQPHEFTLEALEIETARVLEIQYDYDFALSQFRVQVLTR